MTEETPEAEALVREGEEAFARCRDLMTEDAPLPCVVRHEAACGQCQRDAVMEVYWLAFCEVHGAEAKAGALEELYFDAGSWSAWTTHASRSPTLRRALPKKSYRIPKVVALRRGMSNISCAKLTFWAKPLRRLRCCAMPCRSCEERRYALRSGKKS